MSGGWKRHFLFACVPYGFLWGAYVYSSKYIYQNSILVVAIVVKLFIAFTRMKPFYNKWINVVASAAFGVYLIHDNRLVRPYL